MWDGVSQLEERTGLRDRALQKLARGIYIVAQGLNGNVDGCSFTDDEGKWLWEDDEDNTSKSYCGRPGCKPYWHQHR